MTSRKRCNSGTCLRICFTSAPSFGVPGRFCRVARDVDAGEHDFAIAMRSTRRRTCVTISPIGTERELPRPYGMMQKVQR